jgi:hypothetical protein
LFLSNLLILLYKGSDRAVTKNKNGSTLIESLVVIVIISTLATLVITGITAAQNKAYTARSLMNAILLVKPWLCILLKMMIIRLM